MITFAVQLFLDAYCRANNINPGFDSPSAPYVFITMMLFEISWIYTSGNRK